MAKKVENKKKEIKFETTQLKNTSVDHNNSAVVTFIIALIVIGVLVGGLYFVNAKFVTKDRYQAETTTTTSEPSYDATVILADDSLNQKEKEYMVLFFDKSTKEGSYYSSLASGYKKDTKLYSVDLSNKMNAEYIATSEVKYDIMPTTLDGLKKVKTASPTLIYVKKGKITNYITDINMIYSKLS